MKKSSYILILLVLGLFSVKYSHAQWNPNTSVNLLISGLMDADQQSASTSDGKTWIAFYSQNGGNYDMRAQLIDANGYKLLGDNGILVSNQPSGSATYVFNVCVDASNNFIIACQDERTGYDQTVVYKISQAGTQLWSSSGVVLGQGLAPYPAVLSTGEVIVAWNETLSNTICLQKITTSGTLAWGTAIQVKVGSTTTTQGQINPCTGGKFCMVYQKRGSGISSTLYAQMFDNNGTALYSPVQICDQGTSQVHSYSITGEGDVTYFGYYSSVGFRFNSFLQRINADGSIPWGMNGSNFNVNTGTNDYYQMETYIAQTTGSSYVWSMCTFSDPNQTIFGVYVQKFLKTTGARQFTDQGKIVYAVSANADRIQSDISLVNDAPMFMSYDVTEKTYGARLDASGNFAWTGNRIELGSTTYSKMRYGFTAVGPNRCAGVWTEDRGDGEKGYAQGVSIGGLIAIHVATQGNVPAVINTQGGTLQMVDTVFPTSANQNAYWSIVPGTGQASISTTGLVTAIADGTVWARAVAVQDNTVKDSLMITISNQNPNAPLVTTLPATNITTTTGTLNGTVNAHNYTSNTYFEWGLTASYGNTVNGVPSQVNGNSATSVYADISSLTPNTTYHFRCKATNSYGTAVGQDLTFTTACIPVGAAGPITGPSSVCANSTGKVYSVDSISNATSYLWTLPNGAFITSGQNTRTITVSFGTSSGDVTVSGTNGCSTGASSTLPVTVNPLPVPTITGSNSVCAGTINYTYTTEQGMNNYIWTVTPGGTIQSGTGTYQLIVQWTTPGSQSVTVTYASAEGCMSEAPTYLGVTVNTAPDAAGAITGSSSVCTGQQGVVYSIAPVTNATGYVWNVPTGATITSGQGTTSITIDFAENAISGDVTVYGTNSCGNGTSSTMSVTVNQTPPAPVITLFIVVLSSNEPNGNQWYKDGVAISGATGQTWDCNQTGNGWYWDVVTLNGCPSDTSNNMYVIVEGIGNPGGNPFSLYPNPNDGRFSIVWNGKNTGEFDIEVLNELGSVVYSAKNVTVSVTEPFNIDLRGSSQGLYTVILHSNGQQVIKKFMIGR